MTGSGEKRIVAALSPHRRTASAGFHASAVVAALALAFLLHYEIPLNANQRWMMALALPVTMAIKLSVFRAFALRDLAWRYVGLEDVSRIVFANAAASLGTVLLLCCLPGPRLPLSVLLLDFLLCLGFIAGGRLAIRLVIQSNQRPPVGSRRILIYGAGRAGVILLSEIRERPELGYQVAGFLDDDPDKLHLRIRGVRVRGGRRALADVVHRERIQEVLLALPEAPDTAIASILEHCREVLVATRRIPPCAELRRDQALVRQVRALRVEDLLGRKAIHLEESAILSDIENRVVLVTGAGGSIGSELCRQIARYRPAAIVGLDHSETALYHIDQAMRRQFPQVAFSPELGSIQNRRRLDEIFHRHRPHAVYHAAAYKHVPLMEAHIFEAVENNVLGTQQVARAASLAGVDTVVLISSDKAVRPVSVLGATKRLAELVCMAAGEAEPRTRFLAVRFGNVLGTSGSVVPLFERQIAEGGPLTVTHPDMRRFFMTVSEAAQLTLQAAAMRAAGEILVLNMGEPVRILDLARRMILLSGLRPETDIRIEFTGVRPGEKLCEELTDYEEGTVATLHSQIRAFTGRGVPREALAACLQDLRHSAEARDAAAVVRCIQDLIPRYSPSNLVLQTALKESPRLTLVRAV